MKTISNKVVTKNIFLVIFVQLISTIISLLIGFVVPRFISEMTYSYWQIFLLYANYSAILHFGLFDGFLIRYSKYDFDELDTDLIRNQFYFLNLLLDFLLGVLILTLYFLINSFDLFLVFIVGIGIITKNLFRYASYTFQMTNSIRDYSIINIMERAAYGIIIILLLVTKNDNYVFYCFADILANLFALLFGMIRRPRLYFGKKINFKKTIKEFFTNISVGILVTLATFSFSFLVAGCKIFVQFNWDLLTFGQISFSNSVMNVFLAFITTTSVVILPSINRMDINVLPSFYLKMRSTVSIVLFTALLFYFPCKYILEIWLEKYNEGIAYVGLILPSVIFSSKVNLLTNNYLKFYGKQKTLLFVNLGTMALGFAAFAIFTFLYKDLILMLVSTNVLCFLNLIACEYIVSKQINIKFFRLEIEEGIVAIIYIVINLYLATWIAMLIYLLILVIYLAIHYRDFKYLYSMILNKVRIRKNG